MQQFKNYLLATLGFIMLVSVLATTFHYTGHAQDGPVSRDFRALNGGAEAVPVSGAVSVTNSPTVKAQQNGNWNVTLTNSSAIGIAAGSAVGINPSQNTVQIGNKVTNPVIVRSADQRQPFQKSVSVAWVNGSNYAADSFAVPTGKRLVIEIVSAEGTFEGADNKLLTFSIGTTINGTPAAYSLPFIVQGAAFSLPNSTNPYYYYAASQSLRLYADSGTPVSVKAFRVTTTASGGFTMNISGYLEDAPEAALNK